MLHAAAEAVRAACLRAALDGYERAGMSGLCEEGRWEMVVDAIRSLDVDAIVRALPADGCTASINPAEKGVR
ncbi:MAG: acetyltransferase [Proteobacteria bacterium]|nr:acetyltransferase [Pseudomonadota bacterium]